MRTDDGRNSEGGSGMMTMRDNERGWGEMTEGWIKTTFKRKQ
jgi:hypothetical protein